MNTQQLIATDINEITLLVARAVKGHTAAGHTIRAIAVHQANPQQWAANIAYTQAAHKEPAPHRLTQSPVPNHQSPAVGAHYIKLTDLADRCYYSLDQARKLCHAHGIQLHRANSQGRPHYLSAADARRFAAEQCPGVRIDIDDVLFNLHEDLPIAA